MLHRLAETQIDRQRQRQQLRTPRSRPGQTASRLNRHDIAPLAWRQVDSP
jgi:hypothetical protein